MRSTFALAAASMGLWACGASLRVEAVATWRGDATAAYSLIHDDVCDPAALGVFSVADPELGKRGLHAGFGVVVSACDSPRGGRWDQVKTLVAHGHDVFSHSWDHACMTSDATLAEACDPGAPRSVDFATEIDRAAAALEAATGLARAFFIFPYDVCDPAAVAHLKANGYLAARCGVPGTNASVFPDPFAVNHDVFGPSYSRYFGSGACARTATGAAPVQYVTPPAEYTSDCRRFVLDQYGAKGWGVRELHGLDPVDGAGWETVPVSDYRAHLDHLVAKVATGALWVEGPTAVVKYRLARAACALPTAVAPATLRFPPPSSECRTDATVLSYHVVTVDGSDPAWRSVRQGARELPVKRLSPGHYVVDADPTNGDAVLMRSP
jgi:peptidoglycan/xylan/chitin deacetylase (PgdA/CDA1 family)